MIEELIKDLQVVLSLLFSGEANWLESLVLHFSL
jgi:hypothetical protein